MWRFCNPLRVAEEWLVEQIVPGGKIDAMEVMFGFMLDPVYWIFMIPGLLLAMYAQFRLSSTYGRYIRVGLSSGMTGAEAARHILDRAGLPDVPVNMVKGHLTDHYDPRKRALFLSEENYYNRSIAAVGVAAHEAGHALQHKAAYAPLQVRMALVPVVNIASQAAFWIFIAGAVLAMSGLMWIGVIAFAITTFFQLVTLPVEYDASRRAKAQLLSTGVVDNRESDAVGKVLNAAALTYVAAMLQSLMQLLYFLSIMRGSDREA